MIMDDLKKRGLPALFVEGMKWEERRAELMELLCENQYGYGPDLPVNVRCGEIKVKKDDYGGIADTYCLHVFAENHFAYAAWPITLSIPKGKEKVPVFLFLSFSDSCPCGEELLSRGYALAVIPYQGIVPDCDDQFQNGLAKLNVFRNPYNSWAKISMWAYGVRYCIDAVSTYHEIDTDRIAVIGHSRLGKAAFWAGATDERIALTIAAGSGAGGAALFHGKQGEKIDNLVKNFPYWFCGNFKQYADKEEELPYDAHMTAALIAPRHLYISSASEDLWADPASEFLTVCAVNEVYERLGEKGLSIPKDDPEAGDVFHEGKIAYHIRKGTHYLSRTDWNLYMDYRDKWNI